MIEYHKVIMFRQNIVSCNCQLFTYHTLNAKEFRSPPPHFSRRDQRSKRSLKSQSNSRRKQLFEKNNLFGKFQQLNAQKHQNEFLQNRQLSSVSSNYTNEIINQKIRAQKLLLEHQKYKNIQNSGFPQSYHMPITQSKGLQLRISSPLHSQANILRQVNLNMNYKFNRKDQGIKFIEINQPPLLKIPQSKQVSRHSTLAGSVDPSLMEGWQKISMQNKLPNVADVAMIKSIKIQQNNTTKNSDIWEQNERRLETTPNVHFLSRLSELMSEKSEAQSIYQNGKPQEEEVEYSRVLISCKKLMSQKNGVLEQNQKTKLFNFYQQPSNRGKNSNLFERITLNPSTLK